MREVTGTDGRDVVSNEVYAPGPDQRAVPGDPDPGRSTLDRLVAPGLISPGSSTSRAGDGSCPLIVLACLGVGVAAGLLLIAFGLLGTTSGPSFALPQSVSRQTWIRLAGCLVVAAVVGAATRWPVGAVLAGMATWTLPALLGGDRANTQALARTEAVASWAEMLRDNLGAAAGLEQAIIAAAQVPPAAIADEVTALAADIRAGTRLPDALANVPDRVERPDRATWWSRALSQAAHRQASRLADLLSELAELARKRAAVRLRVAAGRARVRTSARVITATTVVFAAGLVVLNRTYLARLRHPTGQLVLLLVGGCSPPGSPA